MPWQGTGVTGNLLVFVVVSFPAYGGCFASIKCKWKEHIDLTEMVAFLMLIEVAVL